MVGESLKVRPCLRFIALGRELPRVIPLTSLAYSSCDGLDNSLTSVLEYCASIAICSWSSR
jgi:hypothetical protein